jgi:hypothetical protein
MTGRILRLSPLVVLVGALAACGGTRTTTVTVTRTVSPELITAPVRIYFLRDGKVAPVERTLPVSRDSLLGALAAGPTARERALGLTGGSGVAQTVYTLSQFDPTRPVTVGGKQYTRGDLEDVTPAILVETPLPFQTVHGPQLHASGTANTFEATFQYELLDGSGKVLAHHFVTATSGTGTRGTFDFTVPFAVDRAGAGKLVVFENSAENGQRIHQVEIPLTLEP